MAASKGCTRLQTLAVASAVRPLSLEKAKDLAFQVGVPLNVLDDIEARYNGEDRKFHFIQQWLDSDVDACWEKLASGLEEIDMSVLAAEIRHKFVQTTGSSAAPKPTPLLVSSESVTPVTSTAAPSSDSTAASAPYFSSLPPPATTVSLPDPVATGTLPTSHTDLTPRFSATPDSNNHSRAPITLTHTQNRTFTYLSTFSPSNDTPQPQSLTYVQTDAAHFVSVAPTPAATVTSATPTQAEPVNQERVDQVKASIEQFKDEFSNLIVDAQMSWFEQETQEQSFLKLFRCYLLALPVSKKASHVKFFQQHRREILQARDIDVICDILTQYSNYNNYEIIFHLVKKFCGEELKSKMVSYRDSFEEFEISTTIDVYLCAISARPESEVRSGFVRMAMKINKPVSACTLHEIRQLRESIAESANLHSYSMYIENPTEGSVGVVFRVPSHCIWFLARVFTPEVTEKHRLSDVTLAGRDATHWISNVSRHTWMSKTSDLIMKEYVTSGADGQYLQGRDYDTNNFLNSSGLTWTYTGARDFTTGKMFVIKSAMDDDEEMLESLRRESDMLVEVSPHPNIITFIGAMWEETFLESERVSQRYHLFTELAENGNLASMIEAAQEGEMGSAIGVDQSLFYLHQILQGVFHLRLLHILHLNINSKNVLVLEGGRKLKLTNFERALHFGDISKPDALHLTGVFPHFAAPEVIRREEPSFYSDVWSTVCVFIHLLTGNLPGHHAGLISRNSMRDVLLKYRDSDMEKLIPLSEMVLDQDVISIFRNTLVLGSRPSAFDLLKYPALKRADMYEHNFPVPQLRKERQPEDDISLNFPTLRLREEGQPETAISLGSPPLKLQVPRPHGPSATHATRSLTSERRGSHYAGGRREGPSRGQSSLRLIHRRYLHRSFSFTLPSSKLEVDRQALDPSHHHAISELPQRHHQPLRPRLSLSLLHPPLTEVLVADSVEHYRFRRSSSIGEPTLIPEPIVARGTPSPPTTPPLPTSLSWNKQSSQQ